VDCARAVAARCRIIAPPAPVAAVAAIGHTPGDPPSHPLEPRARPRMAQRRFAAGRARQGAGHRQNITDWPAVKKKGMERIGGIGRMQPPQRYGVPSRRATRARRSASDPALATSIPLSIMPSISARMISARFIDVPCLDRMSRASRSRSWICRSNSTTDTLDHVSLWTGGRPGPGFPGDRAGGCARDARSRGLRGKVRGLYNELLVAQTQQ
jgi:hypothetical protein